MNAKTGVPRLGGHAGYVHHDRLYCSIDIGVLKRDVNDGREGRRLKEGQRIGEEKRTGRFLMSG
jgi:hypothetical protein